MAEPQKNSYVITVALFDVKKEDAVKLASTFENVAGLAKDSGKLGEVMVITGHIKDVSE